MIRPLRHASLAATLLACGTAHADKDYAEMDKARIGVVAALDKGDGAELAKYIGKELKLERVWFDNATCRKKFSDAKVTAKQASALAKCFAGLKAWQVGLNIYYGPGVLLSTRFKIEDGKPIAWSMAGDVNSNTTLPHVSGKSFGEARMTGAPTISFDQAALDEIAAVPDTGIAYDVCIDAKGKVTKTTPLMVAANGPVAKQIRAATKSWTFKPFELRAKATTVCATLVQKVAKP